MLFEPLGWTGESTHCRNSICVFLTSSHGASGAIVILVATKELGSQTALEVQKKRGDAHEAKKEILIIRS